MFKLPWVKDNPDHYDEVTGMLLPDEAEKQKNDFLEQKINEAEDLQSLENNPGWKMVRTAIEADIKRVHDNLITAQDWEQARHQQQFILARLSLLQWIDGKIWEAKHLLEEQKQK